MVSTFYVASWIHNIPQTVVHIPIRYYLQQLYDLVYRTFVWKPSIMPVENTVNYIISNHASIARFGDGEFKLIQGGSINFQPYHPVLSNRLREVLFANSSDLLIGIPDVFEHLERYCPFDQKFWRQHLCWNRHRWYQLLTRKHTYANTFLSRFYSIDFNKNLASRRILEVQRLWNNRNLLIVEGQDTKMGVGNKLFNNAKSIRRILCPSKNAFSQYNLILSSIVQYVDSDSLIIMALGPTATILAYDLSQLGLQALDLGHLDLEYEWYQQGTTQKEPIIGKFSNEVFLEHRTPQEVVGSIDSIDYSRQILCVID